MPQGSKDSYTDKQKRQAQHIEKSYEKRGVPGEEAEARAWATVNKLDGGGKKGGSGRGKRTAKNPTTKSASESRRATARKTKTSS